MRDGVLLLPLRRLAFPRHGGLQGAGGAFAEGVAEEEKEAADEEEEEADDDGKWVPDRHGRRRRG